jgi:hypothetical protein
MPAGVSLRQESGTDQPAFLGVARGEADRTGAHSAGEADLARAHRELSRTDTGRGVEPERIREIGQVRAGYGSRKIRVLLNCEGWKVGKMPVYRPYLRKA